MPSWRTDAIVSQLTQPIPTRPKPPPKPRASWANLKVGTQLVYQLTADITEIWTVVSCDSEGVTLVWGDDRQPQRLTDPNWQSAGWAKAKKPRTPKKPSSKENL